MIYNTKDLYIDQGLDWQCCARIEPDAPLWVVGLTTCKSRFWESSLAASAATGLSQYLVVCLQRCGSNHTTRKNVKDISSWNYGRTVSLSTNNLKICLTSLKMNDSFKLQRKSLIPRKIEGRTDKLERSYYLSILPLHNLMNHFKMVPIQVHYLSIFLYFSKTFSSSLYFFIR